MSRKVIAVLLALAVATCGVLLATLLHYLSVYPIRSEPQRPSSTPSFKISVGGSIDPQVFPKPSQFPVGQEICVIGDVLYDGDTPYLAAERLYHRVDTSLTKCKPLEGRTSYYRQEFLVTRHADGTFSSSLMLPPKPTRDPDGQRLNDLQPLASIRTDKALYAELGTVDTLVRTLKPGQQRYISMGDVSSRKYDYKMLGDIPTSPVRYDVHDGMAGLSVSDGKLELCLPSTSPEGGTALVSRATAPDVVENVGFDPAKPVPFYYPVKYNDGYNCHLPSPAPWPQGFDVQTLARGQHGYGSCGFYRSTSGQTFYQTYGNPFINYVNNTQFLSRAPMPSRDIGPNIRYVETSVLWRDVADGKIHARVTPSCPVSGRLYPLVAG